LVPGLEGVRAQILNWAILLAAVALLLGLVNLFQVHFNRMRDNRKPFYSFVLLAAMLVTFVVTLFQGRQGLIADWLFNYVQVPIETSLMALLAITLTIAAARLVQQRNDFTSIVFIATLFLILLGSAPLFGLELPIFTRSLTPYITRVLAVGGMRGLLIGVGLGTLATGLRILLGSDRPFGG
jgi:membrane-associated HD superfamily phosphohydrolase